MAEEVTAIEGSAPSAAAGLFPSELLSSVFETVTSGICLWDPDLRLRMWNSSFQEINSIGDDTLKVGARLADILDNSTPLADDRRSGDEQEAAIREALIANGDLQLDRTGADGRIISVEFSAFPHGG